MVLGLVKKIGIKKSLLAFTLMSGLSFFSGYYFKKSENDLIIEKNNLIKKEYIEFKKDITQKSNSYGIESIFLDKDTTGSVNYECFKDYPLFNNFSDETYQDFFKQANLCELNAYFLKSKSAGFLTSTKDTYNSLFYNIQEINNSTKLNEKELPTEYKNLKNLVSKLEDIKEKAGLHNGLVLIYNEICKSIKSGDITDHSQNILDLTNGKTGDCNDLAPAYVALLNHLGYECSILFSESIKKPDMPSTGHVWLSVKTDFGQVELDPTWYPVFVPLKRATKDY